MKTRKQKFKFNEIDKYRLDDEWVLQEHKIGEYLEKLAKAKRNADFKKIELEVARAEISNKIRKHPEKYGLEKVTEAGISGVVLTKTAKKEKKLAECRYKVDILQAAVSRLSSRGKAISDLIWLHSMGYFATPKIPKGKRKSDISDMKERRMSRKMKGL